MIGWVSQWPALVLLLVWAAAPASVEGVAGLMLVSMNWTSVDGTGTTLTVCTQEALLDGTITLTLTDAMSNDASLNGILVVGVDTCAQFDTNNQTLPAEMTTYELSTELQQQQQNGSVSFSLEGAAIDCGDSHFLRFNLNEGSIDDTTANDCLPSDSLTSSACYVDGDAFANDPVCFSGLDPTNPQLKVCVERTAFDLPDAPVDPFTAIGLRYEDGSFTFNYHDGDSSLAELLILPDGSGSSATVVSCSANICSDPNLVPSTENYDLCGVFIDANDIAVSSGEASFQDTDLIVDVVPDFAIDFHFINKNANGLYIVTAFDSKYEPTEEFSLDCHLISPDTICNGFFDKNLDDIMNIAVSYADRIGRRSNIVTARVPS